MGKMLAITDKQSCSPARSDSHHYPGKSIIRHGEGRGMDPFGSHIQSVAASSLAAECTCKCTCQEAACFGEGARLAGGLNIVSLLHHVVVSV